MKVKLHSALKTKYKNLGFGDKAFDGVAEYLSKTVKEESEIETAISGVEPLLKAFQGDIDKVRNEKSDLQKKIDELEKNPKNPSDPKDPKDNPDEPAWFKSYREKQEAEISTLKGKLEASEKKETQSTYMEKLNNTLKDKVPSNYYAKRNLVIESDEQLQTVATEIETDWTNFRQEQIESGVMLDVPPSSKRSDTDTQSLAKEIEAGTKEIVEQQKKE